MVEKQKMFQVIEGKCVEVVRHGEELLPKDDSRVKECIGQLVLKLTED